MRLEFIAKAFQQLCIKQWIPAWARLAAPFAVLTVVFVASKVSAWWRNCAIPAEFRQDASTGELSNDMPELTSWEARNHVVATRTDAANLEAVGVVAVSLLFTAVASTAAEPFSCEKSEDAHGSTVRCFSHAGTDWVSMAAVSNTVFALGVVAFAIYLFCKLLRADWAQIRAQDEQALPGPRSFGEWLLYSIDTLDSLSRLDSLTLYGRGEVTIHGRNFRLPYGWPYARYDERFWYWDLY